jgi:tetratricopeptide (TPR) repeat protein
MRVTIVCLSLCIAFGCSNPAKPVSQNTNTSVVTAPTEKPQTAIAHGPQEKTPPPTATNSGEKTKWTASGEPIDTKEMDAAIMAAEKALSAKPNDAAAKKSLAEAFYKRAVALTEARQYASALGDYRRTLKYDPANTDAKNWIEQIMTIYASINRTYPGEGEEPPPLPFTKPK